jgi:hypothetical protein
MGDFCVSGFHSHIPIEANDKVVAIICKHTTNALSNCPCYLKGILVPICMPVVAYMGDYGSIEEDEYEENETTRILQELTGKSFSDISESLAQVSEYKMDDKQYPEFYNLFKTFNSCERYYEEYTGTRYHIIYEHYDVYKAMTFEWDYVKQAVKSFFVPVLELLKKNKINEQLYYHAWDMYDDYKACKYHKELPYYNALQAIIEAYLYNNDYLLLPPQKIERVFKDEEYRKKYKINKFPNNKFNKLVINCLDNPNEENIDIIYKYVMQDGNFNINNFKLRNKI